MRFCEDHWTRLRGLIDERGLGGLVAPSGVIAVEQQMDQFKRAAEGEESETVANYDPLMAAHWLIVNNALGTLPEMIGYVMMNGEDAPEDAIEAGHGTYVKRVLNRGVKTWPRCPLCYLNIAHEVSCGERRCRLPLRDGYDWMLERAVKDVEAKAKELRLA